MIVRSTTPQRERTLQMAARFLEEMRRDIERSARAGTDTPPRVRSVHEKLHTTSPEYRTLAIPLPPETGGASPEILSAAIAHYAAQRSPDRLMLALEAVREEANGSVRPMLIAEARDRAGTRMFWMQPFRVNGTAVEWEEPLEGGWRDPGEEEMILDAAYAALLPQ